jgi:hypothetical protein
MPPEMAAVPWPDDESALWKWCVRVKAMFICISVEREFRVLGSWIVRSLRSSLALTRAIFRMLFERARGK